MSSSRFLLEAHRKTPIPRGSAQRDSLPGQSTSDQGAIEELHSLGRSDRPVVDVDRREHLSEGCLLGQLNDPL